MAGGRQHSHWAGKGMLLALCLAGVGCSSTPVGRALFGRRDDVSNSPAPVTAMVRTRTVPAASAGNPASADSTEQTVWRPAGRQGGQSDGVEPAAGVQVVGADAGSDMRPVEWRSRETPVEFAVDDKGPADKGPADKGPADKGPADKGPAKTPDKGAKDTEPLPAPRPLPGPAVIIDGGMPPGMMHDVHQDPVPRELHKMSLPPYTVEPPDILLVETSRGLPTQPVRGQHLVRPDGTINLGIYGSIYVTGMTLDQIKATVAPAIASRLDKDVVARNPVKPEDINVDVLAYNSRVYYVITDGGGYGEQVVRVPVTGNETVLDAIAQINGLPPVASKKHIWVARRAPGHGAHDQVLPVDWCGITQRGEAATNYQLFPGDRVYVKADILITIDSRIAKFLSPIERLLGATLLGSETFNSIRNKSSSGSGGTTP